MSDTEPEHTPHLEHWLSDDLEADADARAAERRVAGQVLANIDAGLADAARRIDARYTAATHTHEGTTPHTSPESDISTRANVDSQPGPTQSDANPTVCDQSALGGAGCALDMTNERDRGMVRESIKRGKRRWAGVDDDLKRILTDGLKSAAMVAGEYMSTRVDPLEAAKVLASVAKTVVAMESQCQADEHRAEDHERIDSGKATGAIKLYAHEAPTHLV
jgi:hypothetical protein